MCLVWKPVDSFVGNSTARSLTCHRSCPVCGGSRSRVVMQLTDFQFYTDSDCGPKRVDVIENQCSRCFAIFLDPCYTAHGFECLFTEAGQSYGASEGRPAEQIDWLASRGLQEPGKIVLDAGCHDGRFLALMSPDLKRIGVDIDAPAVEKARAEHRSQGIEFILGDFEHFRCTEAPDVITMFHVLEHLPRPVEVLKHLRAGSHGQTRLVVEVPILENGFTNDINGFFSVQHLTHFSRRSLRNTFVRAGWEIAEWIEQEGYNGCRVMAMPGPLERVPTGDPSDIALSHRYLSHWHGSLANICEKLRPLEDEPRCVLWGGGAHTEFVYQTTTLFRSNPGRLYAIVDSDPMKQGRTWRGVEIQEPDRLGSVDWSTAVLLISSYGSQGAMAKAAMELGVPEARIIRMYDQVRVY